MQELSVYLCKELLRQIESSIIRLVSRAHCNYVGKAHCKRGAFDAPPAMGVFPLWSSADCSHGDFVRFNAVCKIIYLACLSCFFVL